jgi:uncharacterized protein Yka (UPF0111/DUF47 family)
MLVLQKVIRFLLPREDHFYDFIERQAQAAHTGAQAIAQFARNGTSAETAREAVQRAEHEGDRIVHEMEEALARTFVTPIDREDLHKLSSELDNVLDLTNAAIRACVMLGVHTPTEAMKQLIEHIVLCTERINVAIPRLRTHDYAAIVITARELRQLEKDADNVYRQAISDLFRDNQAGLPLWAGSADARVLIREKTVLEDLENAIDACDAIADTLTNLAIKHG